MIIHFCELPRIGQCVCPLIMDLSDWAHRVNNEYISHNKIVLSLPIFYIMKYFKPGCVYCLIYEWNY